MLMAVPSMKHKGRNEDGLFGYVIEVSSYINMTRQELDRMIQLHCEVCNLQTILKIMCYILNMQYFRRALSLLDLQSIHHSDILKALNSKLCPSCHWIVKETFSIPSLTNSLPYFLNRRIILQLLLHLQFCIILNIPHPYIPLLSLPILRTFNLSNPPPFSIPFSIPTERLRFPQIRIISFIPLLPLLFIPCNSPQWISISLTFSTMITQWTSINGLMEASLLPLYLLIS